MIFIITGLASATLFGYYLFSFSYSIISILAYGDNEKCKTTAQNILNKEEGYFHLWLI